MRHRQHKPVLTLLAALALAACAQPAPPAATPSSAPEASTPIALRHTATPFPSPSPSPNVWLTRTAVWLTRAAGPTSTPTSTRTPAPPSRTPRPSRTPSPTPTGTATVTPGELLAALPMRAGQAMGGYALQRIGGWAPGFRDAGYCRHGPYRWLDGEHLLLFPVVSIAAEEWGNPAYTQPVVAGLAGTTAWALGGAEPSCDLPEWSASLGRLIVAADGRVRLWDLAGNPAGDYPGEAPLHLAPSGRRLLAGKTWIDLDSGRTVSLTDWRASGPHKPAWTADERRIFTCCFSYADAGTGRQWSQAEFPGFYLGGRGSWPGEETWSISYWLPGEAGVMMKTYAIWPTAVDDPRSRQVIPVFDPAAQHYEDLIALLGLETPSYCWAEPAPGGAHAWLGCLAQQGTTMTRHESSYLVNLQTLEPVTLTGRLESQGWSADGRWLAAGEVPDPSVDAGTTWLVDVAGARQPAADAPATAAIWHGAEAAVVLRFADERRLRFYQAESGLARDLVMAQAVTETAWQHNGPGFALATEDGRLWWLADAFDSALDPEPLTEPMNGLHSLLWSPDDGRLAFVSERYLYVISLEP